MMRRLLTVGGVGSVGLMAVTAAVLVGSTDRGLYGWEMARIRGATAGNPLCIGCATKPLAGFCSGSDPCNCVNGLRSDIMNPGPCNNQSIWYKGLNPREIDEDNIDEDDDSIQIKESRECRLEYECYSGTVVNNVECEDYECTKPNTFSECRPCYRGDQTDTVSMPAHYCIDCPP
jgi:hypothetical protein